MGMLWGLFLVFGAMYTWKQWHEDHLGKFYVHCKKVTVMGINIVSSSAKYKCQPIGLTALIRFKPSLSRFQQLTFTILKFSHVFSLLSCR